MRITKFMFGLLLFFSSYLGIIPSSVQAEELYLKNNLQRAQPGDYIVTSANKTLTLLHIYDKTNNVLTVEEISIPQKKKPKNWKEWVEKGAPGNNHWVHYEIDLRTGQRLRSYSFTKKYWFEISENDDLLGKILNLKLNKIPESARKQVGIKPPFGEDTRPLWQPTMIVGGIPIKGVSFDAWRTKWPRDNSDLAGKTLIIYTPQESLKYPSYFPYWLEFSGTIGQAKIRIIDSGTQLVSPKVKLSEL